jgi:hypothetical protein
MNNISYLKAAAFCVPVVGPIVSTPTILHIYDKLLFHTDTDAIYEDVTPMSPQDEPFLDTIQKGRIYSICGLIGSILSVALAIKVIALGILVGTSGTIAIASFTLLAFMHGCNLYRCKEQLQRNYSL